MANSNRKIAASGALYLYGISEAPAVCEKAGQSLAKIGSVGIDGVHAVQALAVRRFSLLGV